MEGFAALFDSVPDPRAANARYPAPSATDRESLCACPYGRSPTRPSHQQEPGSSPTQYTVENATERLRVDVTAHADTATAAQLNRHIATLPAWLRRDRRFRSGGLGLRQDSPAPTCSPSQASVPRFGKAPYANGRVGSHGYRPHGQSRKAPHLAQGRPQRAAPCPHETSAGGARQT